MNVLKAGVVILGLLFVISVVFASLVQQSNFDLHDNISRMQENLSLNEMRLNQTKLMLQEEKQKLNNSEMFPGKFLKSAGASVIAFTESNSSLSYWNKAIANYSNSMWSYAILYSNKSSEIYKKASNEFLNASSLWKDTENYTQNSTYQKYCQLQFKEATIVSSMVVHFSLAAHYLEMTCQYYRANDKKNGSDYFNKYSVEYQKGLDDSVTAKDYTLQVNTLLSNIYLGIYPH